MLHHYWFVKGIIDNNHLAKALKMLEKNQNPFVNKEFLDHLDKMIMKEYPKGYELKSEVFKIKLPGDKKDG